MDIIIILIAQIALALAAVLATLDIRSDNRLQKNGRSGLYSL